MEKNKKRLKNFAEGLNLEDWRLASGLIASTQRRSIAKASAAGLLLIPIFYLLATIF